MNRKTQEHCGSTPRTSSWQGQPSGPGNPPWDPSDGVRAIPSQEEMDLRAGERIIGPSRILEGLIEQPAIEIYEVQDQQIQLSQAISLKRIADVLEGAVGNDGAFCAHVRTEVGMQP